MATQKPNCYDLLKKYANEGREPRSSAEQGVQPASSILGRDTVLEAMNVVKVLAAEEDTMTRLNNTLNMQTSTSYEQIPSFHSEVSKYRHEML